jgi:site-specific DNA-methyltransferase (adenine-specific)
MRASEDLVKNKNEIYDLLREKFKLGDYEPNILYSSSEDMREVKDESIQLIVTSPPYNVGKNYGLYNDSKSKEEYLKYLDKIWTECKRVLCKGGRIAINLANINRKPYKSISSEITLRLRDYHGFKMRGEVIWNKSSSAGVSTAWGSWRSASNPTLRDVHEHIIIFSKDDWKLESDNFITTISPKEFCLYTQSIWNIQAVSSKQNWHPTPFPLELPKRLIQLYTYVNDVVLDPLLGSGTTCAAAKSLARKSIGYEINQSYKDLIIGQINDVVDLAFEAQDINFNAKNWEEKLDQIF